MLYHAIVSLSWRRRARIHAILDVGPDIPRQLVLVGLEMVLEGTNGLDTLDSKNINDFF